MVDKDPNAVQPRMNLNLRSSAKTGMHAPNQELQNHASTKVKYVGRPPERQR